MAGSSPDFDAAAFDASIRATMRMGMPSAVAERVTWHWRDTETFVIDDDPEDNGDPYDWTATPVTDVPGNPAAPSGELQVDYAIEFASTGDQDNPVGSFDTGKAVITLLGPDYLKVKTADWVTIGPNRYEIEFVAPALGLFEATVYQVYVTAPDITRPS